ncbi:MULTISPECIES: TIR domain-containing protein [Streptomyces]|uniref:toll/interleukin-1 receptor domain-containing protein n=1 Tax=Streptomyces TaxID=1883 RepID=UPI00099EEE66|nr:MULTISPECIES: TIR domain-containing protein [Streptomyces]MDI5910810.1 TIR domain-containing protein [Streptomyces sp. 12257]
MQIFISWSGTAAQQCAEALRDWLPYMNQSISPFVSSQDIEKGERGLAKIAGELQACSFGIVCVTRENQHAPWINFESGALSRELGESSLIPFLVDMQVKDLSSGPLTQFQATDSSHKEDVWAMVKSINGKCEPQVESERLRTMFDRFWDDLATSLASIRDANPTADAPQREVSDILDELVKLAREQHARIGSLEKSIGSVGVTNSTSHYTINEPKEVRIASDADDSAAIAARRERAKRVGSMARELIGGRSYVTKSVVVGSMHVNLTCTEEGLLRAHEVRNKLSALAEDYRVSITIFRPDGVEEAAHPPF